MKICSSLLLHTNQQIRQISTSLIIELIKQTKDDLDDITRVYLKELKEMQINDIKKQISKGKRGNIKIIND